MCKWFSKTNVLFFCRNDADDKKLRTYNVYVEQL